MSCENRAIEMARRMREDADQGLLGLAGEQLGKQCEAFQRRFRPAVRGLALSASGGSIGHHSDEPMRESEYKLRAVQQARAEQGVAVPLDKRWLVISDARIARVQERPADERIVLKTFSVSRAAPR